MIRVSLLALTAIIAGDSAVAQTRAIYYPANAGTTWGGGNDAIPLGFLLRVTRYQQLHSAMGRVHILTGMAWRRGNRSPAFTGTANKGGAATLGLTLALSDTSKPSATWTKNYAGPAKLVMKTRKVILPDIQAAPGTGTVAPWNVRFPFDRVWAYDGSKDLCADMNITALPNFAYYLDSASFHQWGSSVNYGASCPTTISRRAMVHQVFVRNRPWRNDLEWSAHFRFGPRSVSAGIALGFQRTNTTVGNWCTKLYINPQLFWLGRTDSSYSGIFSVPALPRSWVVEKWSPALAGMNLYSQGFAADSTAPSGIVLTHGVRTTIPAMSTDKEVGIRIHGNADNVTIDSGTTLATCFFKR